MWGEWRSREPVRKTDLARVNQPLQYLVQGDLLCFSRELAKPLITKKKKVVVQKNCCSSLNTHSNAIGPENSMRPKSSVHCNK
jgi:hypothetical protein